MDAAHDRASWRKVKARNSASILRAPHKTHASIVINRYPTGSTTSPRVTPARRWLGPITAAKH